MFFTAINQMMTEGVDLTIVIRKANGQMAVSTLPKSNGLKDEAQNHIVPLTVSGLPEELDAGFLQTVARPIQKVAGLITNMAQFEAQADFCFPCLMEMRMTRTRMEKTGKRIQPLTDRELQGKVGKRFFSDGKAGPFGFRGKIILAALRYFSRKPCLSGSVYRKALVVQRAAKARIFTIKIIKS